MAESTQQRSPCPHCNTPVTIGDLSCSECGSQLSAIVPQPRLALGFGVVIMAIFFTALVFAIVLAIMNEDFTGILYVGQALVIALIAVAVGIKSRD